MAASSAMASAGGSGPFEQPRPQILAAHVLHHQIGGAVGQRAVVEDRDDRRVLQARDQLRLAPEALARFG